jgi:phosphoribosylanthranilate isomerase
VFTCVHLWFHLTYNPRMAKTAVKICGVTQPEDARVAVEAGAAYIGVNLHSTSKRCVTREVAQTIRDAIPEFGGLVGLFVDAPADLIRSLAKSLRLNFIQLHGGETPEFAKSLAPLSVVKAIQPGELATWTANAPPNLHALLLDTPGGGTGIANDWDAVDRALRETKPTVPIWLAGGLKPDNVGGIVERFAPAVADVSSGVEDGTPGVKSADRIRAFIANASGLTS